ncbi:MAG: NADH-quinone oxidoreductase subunit C [Candidatus Thermoplasmatota archaeon]|nr:NADH-quinone oxidoreductase subunit C [Candidatus Thermoplasmatota archaeon]
MNAQELIDKLKQKFGAQIKEVRFEERPCGVKRNKAQIVWLKVDRSAFKPLVQFLVPTTLHLAVVSGNDLGESIELIYHFSVNYGEHLKEISLNLCVELPKSDLKIESICDLIPGALITEREKEEMFGITIENIPDKRRIFLPEDFPEGIYPWRKDETGIPDKMIVKLSERRK